MQRRKNAYTRPNLVGLRRKSKLQMVKIKYRPIQCKNNVLLLFYRILLVELLSEKSCKTSFNFFCFFNIGHLLLFLFINLCFMIVNFFTYQFIGPHNFQNVGSREYIFL